MARSWPGDAMLKLAPLHDRNGDYALPHADPMAGLHIVADVRL
jgi:hypothetical protein